MTDDFPSREAALDDGRIVLAQRAQDQSPGFKHRCRGEGVLEEVNRRLRGTQVLCDLTGASLHCWLFVSDRPVFRFQLSPAFMDTAVFLVGRTDYAYRM